MKKSSRKAPQKPQKHIATDYDLIVRKITMRDGVHLHTRIYLPIEKEVKGVVLRRSPYDKDEFLKAPESIVFENGLVLVEQSCRGTGLSEGDFYPWRNELDDTLDTIDWVIAQPWYAGKIALDGNSYGAWLQWSAAAYAPKEVVCISASFAPSGMYENVYVGGALSLHLYATWSMSMFYTSLYSTGNVPSWDKNHLCDTLPLSKIDEEATGQVYDFWQDCLANPNFNEYWEKFEIDYAKITAPAFIISGWYDHYLKGSLDNFKAMQTQAASQEAREFTRCIIGPWTHIGLSNPDVFGKANSTLGAIRQSNLFKRNLILDQVKDPLEDTAKIQYFEMGSNEWKGSESWPPQNVKEASFYLHSYGCANSIYGNGTLMQVPPEGKVFDTCIYTPQSPIFSNGGAWLGGEKAGYIDQSECEKKLGILVYTSHTLEEDLHIAGQVKVRLWASSSVLETDFCAKLCDVFPNGKSMNLCEGIVRASFRKSKSEPELLDIDEVYEYEIDCWHTANCFKKGHKIRLEITHSNFPRFDRNLNTGADFASSEKSIISTQVIYHDKDRPSRLIIPVVSVV